jgi:hypothetical protein
MAGPQAQTLFNVQEQEQTGQLSLCSITTAMDVIQLHLK